MRKSISNKNPGTPLRRKTAVHSWPGRLTLDDFCFGVEHFFPPFCDLTRTHNLFGKLDERAVVSVLAGPQAAIEFGQFLVVASPGKQFKSLARSRFDEGR